MSKWVHTWASNIPQWISTQHPWVQGVKLKDEEHGGGGRIVHRNDDEEAIQIVLTAWLMLMGRRA